MIAYISCRCNNASQLAKVKKAGGQVVVTKYNKDIRAKHMTYQVEAGMPSSHYVDIVVEENGKKISELRSWQP